MEEIRRGELSFRSAVEAVFLIPEGEAKLEYFYAG
jgi:hypothetical protein